MSSRTNAKRAHTPAVATQAFLAQRDQLRKEACGAKPGKADEYSVRVTTSCVPQRGEALKAAQAKRQQQQAQAIGTGRVPADQHAKELRALNAVIRAYGGVKVSSPLSTGALNLALRITQSMTNIRQRLSRPDPIERLNHLFSKVTEKMPTSSRHLVLIMTRNALATASRYSRASEL